MSIPNGSNRQHKITKGDHWWWRSTQELSGEERVWLARRHRLDTGKTDRKKKK